MGLLPMGGSCLANAVGAARELPLHAKSRFEELEIAHLLEKFKVPGLVVAIIEDASKLDEALTKAKTLFGS